MKTTLVLMTMMLMAHHTVSTCAKGTLVCDASGSTAKSAVCDFTQSYFLKSDGTCESKTVTGCLLNYFSDADKPCLVCNEGMVLDTKKEGCVAVTDAQKKTNCKTYNKDTAACTSCDDGYYLSAGACAAVTTKVENCGTHSSATECMACNDGYYLKEKACVKIEAVDNCQFHTDRECTSCAATYNLNVGYNETITLDASLYASVASNLTHSTSWSSTNNLHSVCEKVTADNCWVLATSGTCTTCATGYFVNASKLCELNPEDAITNCTKYSSQSVCIECKTNFYVKTSSECAAVTNITNCKTYNVSANSCAACEADYYLNPSNSACVVRVDKAISECKTMDLQGDQCSECNTNYSLTGDSKKCLPDITNCATGQQVQGTNKAALNHTCSTCATGYYLNSNACSPRTVTHCTTWAGISEDKCQTCNAMYKLETNKSCTLNTKAGCTAYTSNTDTCTTCDVTTHFLAAGSCTAKSVLNCAVGGFSASTSAAECTTCNSQWKANSNACIATTQTNCATTNGLAADLCTLCNTGWILRTDTSVCHVISPGVANCQESGSTLTNCTKCLPNYYLANATTCTIRVASLSACATKTANADTCDSCATGKYLSSNLCPTNTAANCLTKFATDNKCATCNVGYWASANYNTSGAKDCALNASTGCADVSGKSVQYNKCSSCKLTTHYQTGSAGTLACNARTNTNCKTGTTTPLVLASYSVTEDKCTNCNQGEYLNSSTTCNAVTAVTKCATYNTLQDKCATCDTGYYLDTVNNMCKLYPDGITNCFVYSSRTTCTSCDTGFYLKSNKCEAVTTAVTSCMTYSSATTCSACNTTHFLSANKCDSLVSASNCGTYATKDTCSTCKENYVLDTSTKKCAASGISNCSVAVKGTANTCTTCKVGYLLADDKKSCTAPSPAITNCSGYVSATKCSVCKTGYFLSLDGKTCTAISGVAGSNCAWGKQLEKPACDVCKYGFKKDSSGACVALADANCIIYNDTLSKCQFCFPGTWMDDKGKCNKDTVTPTSAAVFKSFIALALVTLLARLF